ncbi:uncharacterized protein LOC119077339 [Bradysia coprophila]|uniref:uncharacterized protein LOC119077339 n=1 Tax=Bradysia coprophila TaxID=38358 RepID=UPI00187DA488|nr:uncharacterized protein LOC119077339 [Bradysia coprophila]
MNFRKIQTNIIIETVVFLCIVGHLTPIIVNGQYQTPNNQCGGRFRTVNGTIDFHYNTETNPDPDMKKVCVWTIIPYPFQRYIEVTVDSSSLTCNANNDRLGFTWLNESSSAKPVTQASTCEPIHIKNEGSVLIVVLISESSKQNTGFKLTWRGTGFYSRIRFVTAYNSYGKPSVQPIPYFGAGFIGNSLSTFAFPTGNRTDGHTMEMIISPVKLQTDIYTDCPGLGRGDWINKECSLLMVFLIENDGTLKVHSTFTDSTSDYTELRNENGFYMVFWGGNRYAATGGGSLMLNYTSIRN